MIDDNSKESSLSSAGTVSPAGEARTDIGSPLRQAARIIVIGALRTVTKGAINGACSGACSDGESSLLANESATKPKSRIRPKQSAGTVAALS